MKPVRVISSLIFLLIWFSCGKEQTKVTAPQQTHHIEYYGFALVDLGWDDPTDTDTKTNYVDEVGNFTNIAVVLAVNPNDDIRDRL